MPVRQTMRIEVLYAGLPGGQATLQPGNVVCAAAHVQPHLLLYPVTLRFPAPPCKIGHSVL